SDRLALVVGHRQLAAQAAVEHPLDGVGVGEDRNGAIRSRFLQKKPRVGPFLRRFRLGALEMEAAALDERMRNTEQPWPARLIEVQAARVVAGPQAEAVEVLVT